jgi:hypothetical protein
LGLQTQGLNYVLPLATGMALQQPAPIAMVNAQAVAMIVVGGATSCPSVARARNSRQSAKKVGHEHDRISAARRSQPVGLLPKPFEAARRFFSLFGEKALYHQAIEGDSDSVNLGSNPGPPATLSI